MATAIPGVPASYRTGRLAALWQSSIGKKAFMAVTGAPIAAFGFIEIPPTSTLLSRGASKAQPASASTPMAMTPPAATRDSDRIHWGASPRNTWAGTSLLLHRREERPWRRAVATICASVAALIGGLTVVELATGQGLGIDELLFREPIGARAAAAPGRMGLVAAVSLLISGTALILLHSRHAIGRAGAQALAVATSLLALLPVVGYTGGGEAMYATVPFGIAVHTAVAVAMLNAGILLANPSEWVTVVVSTQQAGGIMARRLLPLALVLPLGLGSLVLIGERAGLYRAASTLSLLVACVIALFSATIWQNARALNRLEEQRERAQHERERSREELAKALAREQEIRGQLEEANRAKDAFLANVSHELRTPLNVILGWTRLLTRSDVSSRRLEQGIEVIDRNARAQATLIEDLLDVSRIVAGKIQLACEIVAPASIVQAAIEDAQPLAGMKGVLVEGTIEPETVAVFGDPARLKLVVWNLLNNAVKFTPAGGRVEVHLGAEHGFAKIQVRDTGRGIPPPFLPHVFERFAQAGNPSSPPGGLGLGLAIVKHLVELHGGTISAESAGEGLGATFTVLLPAHDQPSPELARPGMR